MSFSDQPHSRQNLLAGEDAVVAVLAASAAVRVHARIERDYAPPSGAPLEIMLEQTGRELAGECE